MGIDAILNIKGFAGEKGLEYYREIKVVNLGAQVLVPELVARARAEKADAVMVSQVVTQRDAHIHNTTAMSAAFREAFPAGRVPLLVVGGPRFEEGSAETLGVDRIFGRGTTPGEVASLFRVDPKTVTRWASAGRIGSIRTPGGHRRFRESEVRSMLASLTSEALVPTNPR